MNDLWLAYDSSSEESLERYAQSEKIASEMDDDELCELWGYDTIEELMSELKMSSRERLIEETADRISMDDSYFYTEDADYIYDRGEMGI